MEQFLAYLAGLMTAAIVMLVLDQRSRLAVFRDLVKVKQDFADTVAKAAEANNQLVVQLAVIGDKVQMLEMQSRGTK